tara:strand:+ start:339 stop:1373 length:1035 start_codon:yes stop_codon:yes gene_type:complete
MIEKIKKDVGYIYIMISSSDKRLRNIKIGKTLRSPYVRAKELTTTGVQSPFEVVHYWEVSVDKLDEIEKDIHGHLSSYRIRKNREFFKISATRAKQKIDKFLGAKSKIEELREKYKETEEKKANANLKREEIINDYKDIKEKFDYSIRSGRYLDIRLNHEFSEIVLSNLVSSGKIKQHKSETVAISFNVYTRSHYKPLKVDEKSIPNWTLEIKGTVDVPGGIFSSSKSFIFLNCSYLIVSGEMCSGQSYAKIFGFPQNLDELLNKKEFEPLYSFWVSRIKDKFDWANEYKETFVKEILEDNALCPRCKNGILKIRHRKKDGHPFLGCTKFPKCKFTSNFINDDD